MRTMTGGALILALGLAGKVMAQEGAEGFVACSSQEAIEQYLQSNGELMPDGCYLVGTAVLDSNGMRLCALDIAEAQGGIVGAVAGAAGAAQWWAHCDAISAQLP